MLINSILIQFSLMLMLRAAMLGCDAEVGEVLLTFQVGKLTTRGKISNWESEFSFFLEV